MNSRMRGAGGPPPGVRWYHATRRREILPLIGVAVVLVVGRYSWRAWRRMQEEWDDYEWQLLQYHKQKQQSSEASSDDEQNPTLAIDFGTLSTKLAVSAPPPAHIVVTPQGHRSFFNGILYKTSNDDTVEVKRGTAALEQLSLEVETNAVQIPFRILLQQQDGQSETFSKVVKDVLHPTLEELTDRLDCSFSRFVVTLPLPLFLSISNDNAMAMNHYQAAMEQTLLPTDDDDGENKTLVWVPDAVATVWGAEQANLLPVTSSSPTVAPTVLVVDMGGLVTQVAMVQNDVVLSSVSVPLGGETLIQLVQTYLIEQDDRLAAVAKQDAHQVSALLQVHIRTALAELTSSTQSHIHIPYLFVGHKDSSSSPHWDFTLSRSVLDQLLENHVANVSQSEPMFQQALSPHVPPPTTLSSLYTSLLTQLLEQGAFVPTQVDHVLLVGGMSRLVAARQGLQQSLQLLFREPAQKDFLVVPDHDAGTELTVLGATTVPLHYTYDFQNGLTRIRE